MLCGVAVAMINNACDFCRQNSIIRFAAKYYVFPAFGFFFFFSFYQELLPFVKQTFVCSPRNVFVGTTESSRARLC